MRDRDATPLFPLRPGSPEAKAAGCTCRAKDNPKSSAGAWIQAGCPVHGAARSPGEPPRG